MHSDLARIYVFINKLMPLVQISNLILVYFIFYREVAIYTKNRINQQLLFEQIGPMYSVEKIMAKRPSSQRKGKFQYLIKWQGWDERDSTWEPERHLQFIRDLVEEFQRTNTANQDVYGDESSFFCENKPFKKKISKKKPRFSSQKRSKELSVEAKSTSEQEKSCPQEEKCANSVVREKQCVQHEKNSMNESTLPSISSHAESKPESKSRIKVLGMRKEGNNEFWYYVVYPDGNQTWVVRQYMIQNYPVSLIEFYEEKIVFSN